MVYLVILLAPGSYTKKMAAPFRNRYFAHRGLHTKDHSIPENSIPAFDAACEHGYGIELDVRITKDGEVVVLHDDNLERPCGVDDVIDNFTFDELSEFRLWGTEYKIPLFKDVLKCVNGRAPLIVEIKPCKESKLLSQKTMEILAPYEGDYCVESFDPSIVRWLKLNAPVVLRGQLANPLSEYDKKIPFIWRFFASRCIFNMLTRPHFVAYQCGPKPLFVKLTKLLGAMHFAWTSHPKEMGGNPEVDARDNDAVIFEFYNPPVKY